MSHCSRNREVSASAAAVWRVWRLDQAGAVGELLSRVEEARGQRGVDQRGQRTSVWREKAPGLLLRLILEQCHHAGDVRRRRRAADEVPDSDPKQRP